MGATALKTTEDEALEDMVLRWKDTPPSVETVFIGVERARAVETARVLSTYVDLNGDWQALIQPTRGSWKRITGARAAVDRGSWHPSGWFDHGGKASRPAYEKYATFKLPKTFKF